jgi:hypothetical protein
MIGASFHAIGLRARYLTFTGLLDLYPGAEAAYSLRCLNSLFLNEWFVQVRRDSDNDEVQVKFDKGFATPRLSLNSPLVASGVTFGDFMGVANGFIPDWRDQSNNARNATQATAGTQPKIVFAGVLVNGGIQFVNDSLSYNSLSYIGNSGITSDYLISLVSTAQNLTINQSFFGTGASPWSGVDSWLMRRRSGIDGKLSFQSSSGSFIRPATAHAESETVISVEGIGGDTSSLYVNGIHEAGASVFAIDKENFYIGQRNDGLMPFAGKINEIIVYYSNESANRTAIESNIATQYGITLP